MAKFPRRGDVFMTTFDPVRGSEQGGTRPALIVSADSINRASRLFVVVAVTSAFKSRAFLQDVDVPPGIIGDMPGRVLCSQLRTMSHQRLGRYLGRLPDWLMLDVDDALRLALDL